MVRGVVATLAWDVVLPLLIYFVLTAIGVASVWALTVAAGASVAVLATRWIRGRHLSTLGSLVLVRFALGIVVAVITGNAQFVLAKNYMVTLGIAVFAGATLGSDRPFIARIRRDLSPDRREFDRHWLASPAFRTEHRRLTWMWIVGLSTEVVISIGVIYGTNLTTAVVVTSVLSPITLIILIATTQIRGNRAARSI